jgi:ABC-type multidrug transport system permease subunit
MEFDLPKTAGIFALAIVIGIGGMLSSGMMGTTTILMMVLPSTVIFGLLMLLLGVKHGEYRASQ